ncbi:PQQ-binding-like beta-propeller repeat protein [Streptomyces sp. NPDC101132]|uniref:protein kinase domain-containing protein n=1 Tax=Streptomyces sp. NPDC101132 TaxID=3366110 RepID=UPI00381492D4
MPRSAQQPQPAHPEPEFAGQYRLESVLGSGGMGVVHLASSASGLRLAVKVVHAEFAADPEFRARFRQEVTAARRVSGAFTAAVVDADPEAERPWMATLFVDGPTLAERVKRSPLTAPELCRLGAGLAEALRDIHRAGLVHRDLKPSNVLMAPDGPKVIDFGISRPYDYASDLRTETGKLIGTPPFMAPEQFQRPREVGPAADVFAMGAVLVHAATGRGPFDSDSPYLVAYQVVHHEPDLAGVPEELVPLISACLEKDPAERPALDALIAQLRSAAYPTSEVTRAFIPEPRRPGGARAVVGPGPGPHVGRRPGSGAGAAFGSGSGSGDDPTHLRKPAAAPRRGRLGLPHGRRRRTALAAGAVLTAAAVGLGGYAWTDAMSGSAPGAGSPGRTAAAAAVRAWTVTPAGGSGTDTGTPVCAYAAPLGALLCKGPGTTAARLDPADGRTRWSVPAAGGVLRAELDRAPVFAGGLVHTVAPGGGRLQALDPATGTERWSVPLDGRTVVHTGGSPGTVLLASPEGRVTALDPATGGRRWSKRLGGVGSAWAAGEGAGPAFVVTPSGDGTSTQVRAVDPATGAVLWQQRAPGQLRVAGSAAGALFLLANDLADVTVAVVRIDGRTREVRRVALAARVDQGQASVGADGTVYVVGLSGGLTAVRVEAGRRGELWRYESLASRVSRATAAGDRVYLSAADGRLIALDARRGTPVGQTGPRLGKGANPLKPTLAAPAVTGDRVVGTAPDGSVFAVPAADPAGW